MTIDASSIAASIIGHLIPIRGCFCTKQLFHTGARLAQTSLAEEEAVRSTGAKEREPVRSEKQCGIFLKNSKHISAINPAIALLSHYPRETKIYL